jgi:hypothetical protein
MYEKYENSRLDPMKGGGELACLTFCKVRQYLPL